MHWNESRFRPQTTVGLRTLIALVLWFCASALAMPAANASPPPWAPAHGYHAHQHEPKRQPNRGLGPYINSRGACTWSQLDTALGGALGGVIGSHIGAGSGKAIANVGGVVLGALIGHTIGEHMDATDQ